jgi:hypothetical protein
MATTYEPIAYKSLVNEDNTFGRPRQKMWGVFIMGEYSEKQGDLIPLNAESIKTAKINIKVEGDNSIKMAEAWVKGYDPSITVPETGPQGEEVESFSYSALVDGAQSKGASSGYPLYAAEDVLDGKSIKFYYTVLKTITWDLVLLTGNIQEAKIKVNDWLRMPDPSRERTGINSVMLCEIVPADTVVEA